jgi:hypothetical protein
MGGLGMQVYLIDIVKMSNRAAESTKRKVTRKRVEYIKEGLKELKIKNSLHREGDLQGS